MVLPEYKFSSKSDPIEFIKYLTQGRSLASTEKASTSSGVETGAVFVFRNEAGLCWLWWFSAGQGFGWKSGQWGQEPCQNLKGYLSNFVLT